MPRLGVSRRGLLAGCLALGFGTTLASGVEAPRKIPLEKETEVRQRLVELQREADRLKMSWYKTAGLDPLSGKPIPAYGFGEVQVSYEAARARAWAAAEGAEPLRAYIEQAFPSAPESDVNKASATPLISSFSADRMVTAIQDLLSDLLRHPKLVLALRVESQPETGALFVIEAESGSAETREEQPTDTPPIQLWRGRYTYSVTKAGFKTIQGRLNLVDQDVDSLRCLMRRSDAAGDVLPCRQEKAR